MFRANVRSISIFCVLAAPLSAQVTVSVQGVTATQALLYYIAPDEAACTIQVSESASYLPLVPDVDPTLFPGADSDSTRNVFPAGRARLVRVGLRTAAQASNGRWYSRALASETLHPVKVTCGGSVGTTAFSTTVPESLAPEPILTHPAAWGNVAAPEFDWADPSKPVVDPRTGLKIYTSDPSAWSADTTIGISSGWWSGGNGWTNPGNITAYGSNVASTSNTNSIAVFFDPLLLQAADGSTIFRGGYYPYDNLLDLGVQIYGSGSDSASANRTIQAALSLDSGQTAYTSFVNLALPSSNQPAGTIPAAYPAAYFRGWSKVLPRNSWPRRGFVTAVNGAVTLTKNAEGTAIGFYNFDAYSYFNHDWPAGVKLYIANSSPTCTNNFCTLASVQDATHLTLSENLTLAENEYRSMHLAVIIRKTNATGSVSLSARLRVARGYHHDIWTGGCAGNSVSTTVDAQGNPLGRTITGYPCVFPRTRQEPGGLYFIGASEPAIRLVSLFKQPGTLPGHTVEDSPIGAAAFLGPTAPSFDPSDPTMIYNAISTNGGSIGLFKIHYTSDWRALNIAYQSSSIIPPATTELTWTNITKSADGRDMRTQILANTAYDESRFGSLTSLQAVGTSGKYSVFVRTFSTQESACWIFAFDSTNGNFYRAWRTDDGSSIQELKYAGCHAVLPLDGAALYLSTNGLRWSNTNMPYGGPFRAPVTGVQKGDLSFSSNTALPWPPDSSYNNACPADLPQQYKDAGAVGNQCVTIQTREPCSATPAASEATWSPCPWNAAQSMVAALAEGDWLKDAGVSLDNESFRIVRKASLGDNLIQLVLQRNASYSYCAIGKDGVANPAQAVHANGWSIQAVPPESCYSAGLLIDIEGNAAYSVNQNIIRGHFDVARTGASTDTWIGAGSSQGYLIGYDRSRSNVLNKADYAVSQSPLFAGWNSNNGYVQSYISAKQKSTTGDLRRYAFDFRHYNGSSGSDLEYPNQYLGAATNLTLQSGTTAVYKLSFTGTADVKRGVLNVWAGEKVLIEKSSPATGDTLSDSDAWRFCYAYRAGECRSGSSAGDLYAVLPRMDSRATCWASQLNARVPCAFAGPVPAMQAIQVRIDMADGAGLGQRLLGNLLMGPSQQYVYSKVLPTPDASYLLFAGFLVNGYHTGLMAAKLPSFRRDSVTRSTYVPVIVRGRGSSVYVEFGYEEFGSRTDFYCTARQEVCRVSASSLNDSSPFAFASEALTPAGGEYSIAVPAVAGRVLYYRVVDGGTPGRIRAVAVP